MKRPLALIVMLLGGAARAQQAGFDATQFHPTATGDGYFAVDGAFTLRHVGGGGGVYLSYAHRPLVLRDPTGMIPPGGEVIPHQLVLDFVASFALFDRVEIGVDMPVVAHQPIDDSLLANMGGRASAGAGDLRFDVKVRMHTFKWGEHRLALGAVAALWVPSGDALSFMGQGGLSGFPRVLADWRWKRLAFAARFGAVLRSTRSFGDLHVTHQLAWGVAGRVDLARGFSAMAEVDGLVGVGQPPPGLTAAEAPTEILAGLRWGCACGFRISLAGGAGLTRGYGTPDGRLIFGIRWESPPKKVVPPPPPPRPETITDSDQDGVADAADRCPREVGPAANGGCPDPDTDGDGTVDRLDKCPQERGPPQPGSGREGCPPPDSDNDGVSDALDRCPDVKGNVDNYGCPDVDSDGDGLIDRLDKCPFDLEVYNGNDDEDGCPDPGPPLAELAKDKILLKQPFLFNGAVLDLRSFKTVAVVARLLTLHPEITRLRIEGYTDNRGSALDNLELSRKRAAAVRRLLVEGYNVDGKRLLAQGFGSSKNARIELVIVEREQPQP
jgi:outer membrane protein OmpA-like peptidoglycan-associated protein